MAFLRAAFRILDGLLDSMFAILPVGLGSPDGKKKSAKSTTVTVDGLGTAAGSSRTGEVGGKELDGTV